MSNYSFINILEYIPKKYVGLSSKQQQDRQAVYSFKDGHCPEYVKQQLLDKVRNIISGNPTAWVVCFIPAIKLWKIEHPEDKREMQAYKCSLCHKWHIGHTSEIYKTEKGMKEVAIAC